MRLRIGTMTETCANYEVPVLLDTTVTTVNVVKDVVMLNRLLNRLLNHLLNHLLNRLSLLYGISSSPY